MLLFKFGCLSANFVVFWQLLFWKALTFAITFLYACLQTYYGMAMSVRVSVRLSVTVFRTFLLHALTYWAEILYIAFFLWTFDQVRVSSIFVGVMPLVELRILEIHSFTHFSLTYFDILSLNSHMTSFDCTTDQVRVLSIALIFVGVMPLLELRILKIHSFLHFSLTWFDILSWKFAYYFLLLYYRSSSSVVILHQFLWE